MTLYERQREFANLLVKGFPEQGLKGLPLISACAIVGNGSVENKMLPTTTGVKDHGSDAVLQWRADRLEGPHGLKGWAAARGFRWDTLWTQAAFTLWELARDYSDGLERRLRNAPTKIELNEEGNLTPAARELVNELTEDFCRVFERPNMAVAGLKTRQSHARSVLLLMLREKQVPSVATQASIGTVVVGGAAAAIVNSSWSTLALALFIAAIIWVMGEKPKPITLAEFDEDELEPITPLEITASETAEFDAADAAVLEAERKLAEAITAREAAKIRVRERVQTLLAVIEGAQAAPERKEDEHEHNGKDDSNQLANKPTRRDLIGSVASGPV